MKGFNLQCRLVFRFFSAFEKNILQTNTLGEIQNKIFYDDYNEDRGINTHTYAHKCRIRVFILIWHPSGFINVWVIVYEINRQIFFFFFLWLFFSWVPFLMAYQRLLFKTQYGKLRSQQSVSTTVGLIQRELTCVDSSVMNFKLLT